MQKIDESKYKTKNIISNRDDNTTLINDNSGSFQIIKNQKPTVDNSGKKALINYEESKNNDIIIQPKTLIRRSNSIKLYKMHKKEKEEKKNIIADSGKNINNNENTYMGPETNNQPKKVNKESKKKNVSFLEPNFVTIIDVESFKKFNAENTCKDPFEDLEFLKNVNNININNNNINNNNIKKGEEDNRKERVKCSCTCSIF